MGKICISAVSFMFSMVCFGVNNDISPRRVSATEVEFLKLTSNAGILSASVKLGNKLLDKSGGSHKVFVTYRAYYQLDGYEGQNHPYNYQPEQCSDIKILKKSRNKSQYITRDGKLKSYGQPVKISEEAKDVKVPLSTFVRIEKNKSREEIFCVFNLIDVGLTAGVDDRISVRTMNAPHIPFQVEDEILNSISNEVTIDYEVMSGGMHGPFVKCNEGCSISINKKSKPVITFKHGLSLEF
ncbi:MAG: hypothetical protein HOO06_08425 [Bdellovibrionaceae bacterium]|jgi:hypothetical protein|nr:hypothetical protein [Pseudobdellovibrionaceae bacterium]